MTPWEDAARDAARLLGDPELLEAGMEQYAAGRVLRLTWRRDRLLARVRDPEGEVREVTLVPGLHGESEATCTCPAGGEGACAHVAAAVVACLHEPERVETGPLLEEALAPLEAGALRSLLLELAERDPDLAERIEARALAFRLDTRKAGEPS